MAAAGHRASEDLQLAELGCWVDGEGGVDTLSSASCAGDVAEGAVSAGTVVEAAACPATAARWLLLLLLLQACLPQHENNHYQAAAAHATVRSSKGLTTEPRCAQPHEKRAESAHLDHA